MECVLDSVRRMERGDANVADLLDGRVLCTEVIQALKYRASRVLDDRYGGGGDERASPSASGRARAPRHSVLKHVYVVDMQGVRVGMLSSRVRARFRAAIEQLELLYPEVVVRTYVVNAPRSLTLVWTMVKLWLVFVRRGFSFFFFFFSRGRTFCSLWIENGGTRFRRIFIYFFTHYTRRTLCMRRLHAETTDKARAWRVFSFSN